MYGGVLVHSITAVSSAVDSNGNVWPSPFLMGGSSGKQSKTLVESSITPSIADDGSNNLLFSSRNGEEGSLKASVFISVAIGAAVGT